ncbi:MAG: hypothetical protein FJX64_04750 [Alphaproteobacteria bacterium]|nr:hypothetical protein [Alphaproteobacteria bacterium]
MEGRLINKNNNPVWLACGIALGMLIGVSIRTTPSAAEHGTHSTTTWVVEPVTATAAQSNREVVCYNTATGAMQLCNLATLTYGNYVQP